MKTLIKDLRIVFTQEEKTLENLNRVLKVLSVTDWHDGNKDWFIRMDNEIVIFKDKEEVYPDGNRIFGTELSLAEFFNEYEDKTNQDEQNQLKREFEKDSTLVTPSMRALYVDELGFDSEDEVILEWHNIKPIEPNHIEPSHYVNMKISPLEYIEANPHLTWCLSNAIKYISRAGKKENNPILQDLKKAQWYLNHEIEELEAKE